ncbi:hypothetical protein OIU76_000804 [Salix suchowensis]|nr:hypothetical protein OIU76_000804 [Salix suchowensis]KAJ6387294.1 hypothetical protein OIU78_017083 [Salix suchowensis]
MQEPVDLFTRSNLATSAPKCSSSAFASSNCYLLINVKPDEERVLLAWFSVFLLAKTDLKRVPRSNFYAHPLKNEGQYSVLPR